MASNKSVRKTNEGYLARDGKAQSSLKLKLSKDNEKQKNTQSKLKALKQTQHSGTVRSRQTTSTKYNKHNQISYSQQSQQQDSDYQYSSNLPQNPIPAKSEQRKQLPSKTHTSLSDENHKLHNQIKTLQHSLKQAFYQNQLLKQKLSQSQTNYHLLVKYYQKIQIQLTHRQNQYQSAKEPEQKNTQEKQFIAECHQQIKKLKTLIKDLTEQKQKLQFSQAPSQRQEIKDRIIMKLEDQLITVKLLLQEQKQKYTQKTQLYQPLHQISQNYTARHSINNYSAQKTNFLYD